MDGWRLCRTEDQDQHLAVIVIIVTIVRLHRINQSIIYIHVFVNY